PPSLPIPSTQLHAIAFAEPLAGVGQDEVRVVVFEEQCSVVEGHPRCIAVVEAGGVEECLNLALPAAAVVAVFQRRGDADDAVAQCEREIFPEFVQTLRFPPGRTDDDLDARHRQQVLLEQAEVGEQADSVGMENAVEIEKQEFLHPPTLARSRDVAYRVGGGAARFTDACAGWQSRGSGADRSTAAPERDQRGGAASSFASMNPSRFASCLRKRSASRARCCSRVSGWPLPPGCSA